MNSKTNGFIPISVPFLSGNEQKILSGIDFIGPDLHTEPCMNLETAFFKDFFRDVDSHINIYSPINYISPDSLNIIENNLE